jgi:peptide subunit release factor 1 (eRF1)
LRHRDGREWTKEHYRSHRRARINQFIREEIRTLDRIFTAGGYEHLVLAGNPRATSRINNALPAHLAAKLIDIVPASEYDRTRDVVAATLACFVEREEQESLSKVDKLLQEMKRHHGFAVSGTRASLAALMKGQVDVLVLAKGFQAEPAWACDKCDVIEVGAAIPPACPKCGERQLQIRDLKEDLVRLAERSGCEVEIVNHSDALMRVGGVGCLLRFLRPESYGTKAA